MKRVDALLAEYGHAHRRRGNLACHAAGITLIVFGILAVLQAVPVAGRWNASELALGLAFLFYLTLDVPLALALLVILAALDLAARAVGGWRLGAAAFVAGWVLQAVGHAVYEKNSPAFFRNLVHLLIGPAFLVNEALRIRVVPGTSDRASGRCAPPRS
jgi:uncharacterized membrane protein YGL010W